MSSPSKKQKTKQTSGSSSLPDDVVAPAGYQRGKNKDGTKFLKAPGGQKLYTAAAVKNNEALVVAKRKQNEDDVNAFCDEIIGKTYEWGDVCTVSLKQKHMDRDQEAITLRHEGHQANKESNALKEQYNITD